MQLLDCKAPESKVTKAALTSSTAPVAASSTAKATPSQSDQQFSTPERDEWDHEEATIERMQRELDAFAKKCNKQGLKYNQMKRDLEDLKQTKREDDELRRKAREEDDE